MAAAAYVGGSAGLARVAGRISTIASLYSGVLFLWVVRDPVALLLALPFVYALRFIATSIHEVGHAIAALCLGGRLRLFAVRPVAIMFAPLRVRFIGRRRQRDLVPAQGRVEHVASRRSVAVYAIVSIGGPLASATVAAVLAVAVLTAPEWSLIARIEFAMLPAFAADAVVTLLPYRGSDGRSLLRLWRLGRVHGRGRAPFPLNCDTPAA